MAGCADHARGLHGLDEISRAIVADLEAPLHRRNGRLPAFRHEGYGLIIECVAFGVTAFATATTGSAKTASVAVATALQNILDIIRLPAFFPLLHNPVNLWVVHKGTVHPDGQARARRHVQHVTM